MSARDTYPAGVPCWVDTFSSDPDASGRFYAALFGWELSGPGPMPDTPDGRYYVATLDGDDVAGIGSGPAGDTPPPSSWVTSIAVDSADEAAERAVAAGGTRLGGPFDVDPAGRLAVLCDPTGRDVRDVGGEGPPRRAARQRARRLGDEPARHARPRPRRRLLQRAVRLDDRGLRPGHAVPPARLRGRRAASSRSPAR